MADAYIGEIRLFAGTYAPRGWALCNGQLLSIQQNTALFSILGIQYGGDGKTNFALPDFRNRVPVAQGSGPGLTPRTVGSKDGDATVTLSESEIPAHSHAPNETTTQTAGDPTGAIWSTSTSGRKGFPLYSATPSVSMNVQAIDVQGGNQPHNNMQPFLTLNFIICVSDGLYPMKP